MAVVYLAIIALVVTALLAACDMLNKRLESSRWTKAWQRYTDHHGQE